MLALTPDFDMSLRAQMKGYTTRWVTYSNGGFKEGVSLTCDNELDRWQKVRPPVKSRPC